jgi:hypothetical protein
MCAHTPVMPLAEVCKLEFGTFRPKPPLPTPSIVIELRGQVAFLTSQLVDRERVLQVEKDEFVATVSRTTTLRIAKVQEELAEARKGACAPPDPPPTQLDDASKKETAAALATVKRLSDALAKKNGELAATKKSLEDEIAFTRGLGENKEDLEKQLAEAAQKIKNLTFELSDTGNAARMMAQELLTLRPTAIELEVWRLWLDTETRLMTREGREKGTDAFCKAALNFVTKYRTGQADEWVGVVVTNRTKALHRAFGDGDLPEALEIMYMVAKDGTSNTIPTVVAAPPLK